MILTVGLWILVVVTGGNRVVIVVVVFSLSLSLSLSLCCVVVAKVEWWLWPVVGVALAVADGRGGWCSVCIFWVVKYIILL